MAPCFCKSLCFIPEQQHFLYIAKALKLPEIFLLKFLGIICKYMILTGK